MMLFNNAGLGPRFATAPSGSHRTAEGLELGLGSMHFGHFYLVKRLLAADIIHQSITKIVNTAFAAPLFGSFHPSLYNAIPEGDLRGEVTATTGFCMYTRAKLANVLLTKALAERGFRSCCMHVGAVETSIWDVPPVLASVPIV